MLPRDFIIHKYLACWITRCNTIMLITLKV